MGCLDFFLFEGEVEGEISSLPLCLYIFCELKLGKISLTPITIYIVIILHSWECSSLKLSTNKMFYFSIIYSLANFILCFYIDVYL